MNYNEVVQLGSRLAIEKEASFKKIGLYYSIDGRIYSPRCFDLYEMFTVKTQHTYGTLKELYFIFVTSSIPDKSKRKEFNSELYKKS